MEFNRSSGILLHPTSLPSKYGIGDLGKSAFDFIDFLVNAKQTLWQVLPLNPTSFGDSPYQSFSTFAGNPLLISFDVLKEKKYLDENDLKEIPTFDEKLIEFGELIDYKMDILKIAFTNFKKLSSQKEMTNFKLFCEKNKMWLEDYTLFIAIKNYFIKERKKSFETKEYKQYKNKFKLFQDENMINDCFYGASWLSWEKDLIERKPSTMEKYKEMLKDEIAFQSFLQFEFFAQWQKVHNYASDKGVQIIGDIPIYVAQDSADVWSNKELFKLGENGVSKVVAGVPPDYFSETGQLWGNPLYDWDYHEKTGFAWWIERVKSALSIVDILRIDHFRGFESFWEIDSKEKTAINGKWVKGPGKKLFVEIKKVLGDLPIIAEDLGLITKEVSELIKDLDLPGMRVLQFGFDAGQKNTNLAHNYETSKIIVYTGTHDNDTTKSWYETADEKIKDQARRYMNTSGENIHLDMIRLASLSVGVFAIFPLQDVLGLGKEARMNTPGVLKNNWQFRFVPEDLTDELAEKIAYLTTLGDRNIKEKLKKDAK